MTADRWIKTGDSYKPLCRVLVDDDGRAVNVATALGVRFIARLGTNRIHDTMTVTTPAAAVAAGILVLPNDFDPADLNVQAAVVWNIDPEDTATVPPGDYPFEIEVTWNADDIETFPTRAADNPVLHIELDQDRAT